VLDLLDELGIAENERRVKRMAKLMAEHLAAAGAPDIRKDWKVKDVTKPVTAK
jgi:hypothetical protein